MAEPMLFGTEELLRLVTCPQVDADVSAANYSAGFDLEGGGTVQRNSAASHRQYVLSWPAKSAELIELIESYALGSHGDPNAATGLIHFLDPATKRTNVLPQFWAAPRVGALDGPVLSGVGQARPTLVTTASNTQDYPAKSAVYTLAGTETPAVLRIPVPAGHTLHVGFHGSATSTAVVTVQPDGSSVTNLTPLACNTTTRTNYSHAAASHKFVSLSIDGAGTLTMAGLIAQVLPTGEAATTGRFISGQGHSGCKFVGMPKRRVLKSAPGLDLQSLSAVLVEVGGWLR